ncbi:MAG: N-acetyltransferase [Pseudomonadota bacterium]
MTLSNFAIRPEAPDHQSAIDHLHAACFGPGRHVKAAFQVREGTEPVRSLSFVALNGPGLIGSVRYTAITIGTTEAMLLGPLAVHPIYAGKGAGRALMRASLEAAAAQFVSFVVLVGDLPYYEPFGFSQVAPGSIRFPAPVDPARVLAARPGGHQKALPSGAVAALSSVAEAYRDTA